LCLISTGDMDIIFIRALQPRVISFWFLSAPQTVTRGELAAKPGRASGTGPGTQ